MNRAMQSQGGRGLVAGLELVTTDFHFQIMRKDSGHFRHFLRLPSQLLIEIPQRDGGIHSPILHYVGYFCASTDVLPLRIVESSRCC